MALSASLQAIYARLKAFYNGGAYSAATNPGGFARGGNQQGAFIDAMRDFADFGAGIADIGAVVQTDADRFAAAVAAIEAGPVISVNGMSGAVVLPEVPKVLPPIVTQPAQGSTPSLTGGALLLAVDRLTSLYGEIQKTIRFRVATASSFAANTIVFDSGVLTQTGVSTTIPNAQSVLTGGQTYYVDAIQTDAKDVSSGRSAPVSFTFPVVPNAAVMSAPANNATGVGAQNQPITLTASAYSHPGGVAQAARRFELSKDNFATVVTVAGAVGQASATIASPKDVLTANTPYKVRAVDTDTNGGVATGVVTTFTTVAAFRPNVGDAYQGGFFVGQINDGGTVYDLIVAPRSSGQNSGAWQTSSTATNFTSRIRGANNSAGIAALSANGPQAAAFCENLVLNGYSDWYLPAIDELEIAYRNMKPTANNNNTAWGDNSNSVPVVGRYTSSNPSQTSVSAFSAQGSGEEAFAAASYWSSTENASATALSIDFTEGTQIVTSKTNTGIRYRAFRRVAA